MFVFWCICGNTGVIYPGQTRIGAFHNPRPVFSVFEISDFGGGFIFFRKRRSKQH